MESQKKEVEPYPTTIHISNSGSYGNIKGNVVVHTGNVILGDISGHLLILDPNAHVTVGTVGGHAKIKGGKLVAGIINGNLRSSGFSEVFANLIRGAAICEGSSRITGVSVKGTLTTSGRSCAKFFSVTKDTVTRGYSNAEVLQIRGGLRTEDYSKVTTINVNGNASCNGRSVMSIYSEIAGSIESRDNSSIYAKAVKGNTTSRDNSTTICGSILGANICTSTQRTQTKIYTNPQVTDALIASVKKAVDRHKSPTKNILLPARRPAVRKPAAKPSKANLCPDISI